MFILSRKALRAYWERHKDAREPLQRWLVIAEAASWQNFADLRRDFRRADLLGECVCFDILDNRHRLIVKVNYAKQKIFIRFVLTHAEYDRKPYKKDCNC